MVENEGTSQGMPGTVRSPAGTTGRANEGRTVVIQLEIQHRKDLPDDAAEQIAQRAYGFLYSRGVEVGVRAKLMVEEPEPKQKWEQA